MIRVNRLIKRFGSHTALNDVSLDIRQGECFALLGPNGSGKTTMLKCLAGLIHPSSGALSINGVDVLSAGSRARGVISYLPQQAGFPEQLRVREVLDFYRRLRGLPVRRVDEVLDLLDCRPFASRSVDDLSGGMRQRLAIAVVCLPGAPVLLLDEPTASLDPESAAGFRGILDRLKTTGTTIVFSTHVLADVEALADRIAVLMDGRLLAVETTDSLRREVESPRRLRVRLETMTPQYARAARAAGADVVTASGSVLTTVCEPDRKLAVLRALELSGAVVESFSTEDVTLEQVYARYLHAQSVDCVVADDSCGLPLDDPKAC
jgi:Cu-processing system ATP-binding protein